MYQIVRDEDNLGVNEIESKATSTNPNIYDEMRANINNDWQGATSVYRIQETLMFCLP